MSIPGWKDGKRKAMELAGDWTLALTAGGVDQDLLRLGHHNLQEGVYPFDRTGRPPLEAVVGRRGEEIAP
ncbi:hypothetical protein [Microbacterium paludicola]|uniref:hypothetical protein n=1 Tax=Microbacterium paludicola TaxID=300019 RepID=UPI0011A4409F|nr:hypothetical protein [Microbacterium paludicola]